MLWIRSYLLWIWTPIRHFKIIRSGSIDFQIILNPALKISKFWIGTRIRNLEFGIWIRKKSFRSLRIFINNTGIQFVTKYSCELSIILNSVSCFPPPTMSCMYSIPLYICLRNWLQKQTLNHARRSGRIQEQGINISEDLKGQYKRMIRHRLWGKFLQTDIAIFSF
jgi:hypothetical protein